MLLVPINVGNNHWTLIHVGIQNHFIKWYGPLQCDSNEDKTFKMYTDALMGYLQAEHMSTKGENLKFEEWTFFAKCPKLSPWTFFLSEGGKWLQSSEIPNS